MPRSRAGPAWLTPLASFVALAVAVLAPIAPAWLAGKTLVNRDAFQQFAPLRWLVGDALRHVRIPLWNPFVATGMPLHAEVIHGALHPVSIASAFLFPRDGLDPLFGAYLVMAAAGAMVLGRTLGLTRTAAAATAIAYALSGPVLSSVTYPNLLAGAASLPWLVAGVRAAWKEASPRAFAAGAIGVAVCALSGDLQVLLVGLLLGTVLAKRVPGWRHVLGGAGSILVGLLLAGVALVPAWVHLGRTARAAGARVFDASEWSFAPVRLVELIAPGFLAHPETGTDAPVFVALAKPLILDIPFFWSAFVGAGVLLLALAAMRRKPTHLVLLGACIAFLWFSMGDRLGGEQILSVIPLVKGFRFPERFLVPAVLCLALLAGLGLDRILAERSCARRLAWWAAGAAGALAVAEVVLATTGAAALLTPSGSPVSAQVRAYLASGLFYALLAASGIAAAAVAAIRGIETTARAAFLALLWCAGAVASPFALRPGRPEARLETRPPTLVALPPGPRLLNLHAMPVRPPAPGYDAIDQRYADTASVGLPNLNARYSVDNIEVDSGLEPAWFRSLAIAAGEDWPILARRYGVTHVLYPEPRTERGRNVVAKATAGGVRLPDEERTGAVIWAVPHRPWASFAPEAVVVGDRDEALATVLQLNADASQAVAVEGNAAFATAPGQVLSFQRGIEDARIEALALAPGLLVVNDAWWPGWRATLDGREVPLLRADALVRAVQWPAGRHVLEMRYEPPEVTVGIWCTVADVFLLAGVCVMLGLRPIRRADAEHAGTG